MRGTTTVNLWYYTTSEFLSTYPVRGTTFPCLVSQHRHHDFYPRTPCGVRQSATAEYRAAQGISIHVPRAGYDKTVTFATDAANYFYPRTPCGVRHAGEIGHNRQHSISIHVPRAGYDPAVSSIGSDASYFYPRTPCGVRPSMDVSSV